MLYTCVSYVLLCHSMTCCVFYAFLYVGIHACEVRYVLLCGVCMYACMYVCLPVCLSVCMYVCMCVCTCAGMCVCMYVMQCNVM